MEKSGLTGIFDKASGYVMNAKPAPDASAYFSTDSPSEAARKPIVAKTAKPAKTPVKQSQETTMHICLQSRSMYERTLDEKTKTDLKKLLLNLFAAE